MDRYGEYSEFICELFAMKFEDEKSFTEAGATGSIEEAMDSKTIVKKYKGIESKFVTKGTGAGELKVSIHMNYDIYKKTYGMNLKGLEDGVASYGQKSVHSTFGITAKVLNEDDVVKFKAYPKCTVANGLSRKIVNGDETVAELDMTIKVMPDSNGQGMYEALEEELSEELQNKWMTEFTPELVKAKEL